MIDFTIQTYIALLKTLQKQGFSFQTFEEFITDPKEKVIVMRHDVDRIPANALRIAEIENDHKINATYYFRMVKGVYNVHVIKAISDLGHEIGYHYENMDTCRGDVDKAYDDFCRNLENFRKIVSIKTVCMHGSPLSKYDNRAILSKYDYRSLGVIAEPYFDVDYSRVLYLTDTGRRWDGGRVNVRDKVLNEKPLTIDDVKIRTTKDLIDYANAGKLPIKVVINTHPQRWFNMGFGWFNEYVTQNFKNIVKFALINNRRPCRRRLGNRYGAKIQR